MSFLKLGENLREQVSIFIENAKRIEGIEKIINLTAEKFLTVSKDPDFESKLANFFMSNLHKISPEESKNIFEIFINWLILRRITRKR